MGTEVSRIVKETPGRAKLVTRTGAVLTAFSAGSRRRVGAAGRHQALRGT